MKTTVDINEIHLSPMTTETYHEYFRGYQNDPVLFTDQKDFKPFVYGKERVDNYIRRLAERGRFSLAVTYGKEIVGEIVVKDFKRGESLSFGISLKNDDCKNKGIGTQAERLFIEYAFNELDTPLVLADVLKTNTRSIRVLEKLGFERYGQEGDFILFRIKRGDKKSEI